MRLGTQQLYDIFLNYPVVTTDSRNVIRNSLFFALKGENFNGNRFAQTAVQAGAAYAVIDDPAFETDSCLLVEDVLLCLQQLAQMHREKFSIPVLAITGSNGKTTTKELVNALLSSKFKVIATQGNLNNHIGVPLTLLQITKETQIAIIEIGANHQGEIRQLCSFAKPTHGLITNIGKAHIGGFGGFEGVIKAKSELYDWLRTANGIAFVNGDNQLLCKLSEGINSIYYGSKPGFFVSGSTHFHADYLQVEIQDTNTRIQTQLIGAYNGENVLAAICIGRFFQVPDALIYDAIEQYKPSNSRSQVVHTKNNTIILDAYNANPSSMQAAIHNFIGIKSDRKMAILGDMLELGAESHAEHLAIVQLLIQSGIEKVVLVGPDFVKASKAEFPVFPDSETAREWLLGKGFKGYNILLKGSRGIKMEKVLDAL